MIQDPNLKILEFGGLNTQSPKGTTLQPCVLENVWLDHKGGYSTAAAGSRRMSQVILSAIHTGLGERLFVKTTTNWGEFKTGVYTVLGTTTLDFFAGFPLSPDLVLVPGPGVNENTYFTSLCYVRSYSNNFLTYWDGTGTQPTGAHYFLEGIVNAAPGTVTIGGTQVYFIKSRIMKIFVGATRYNFAAVSGSMYSNVEGFQTVNTNPTATPPPTSAKWPVGATHYRLVFWGLDTPRIFDGVSSKLALELFHSETPSQTRYQLWDNPTGVITPEWYIPPIVGAVLAVPALDRAYKIDLTARVGTYHGARAWVAPSSVREYNVQLLTSVVQRDILPSPSLLMYSEVYYPAQPGGSYIPAPTWRIENSLSVPFKVSEQVVALASLGRYLYILGDQEVFLLTGSSELDFYVESIGDSVGCVSSKTVQRLYNRLFWLSTSGLQMAQGGQISDVSADIRDLILTLNIANLSSTVDFARELYYLTDGAITLCLDTQTGGWSTRTTDGTTQRLVFGGGVAYVVATQALFSLDGVLDYLGVKPGWKIARIEWEGLDLGDLWNDKTFHGLSVGMDTDGAATVTDSSTVNAAAAIPQSLGVTSGVTGLRYRWKGYKSAHLKISLTLSANLNTTRALLRPPLTVAIADMREARV